MNDLIETYREERSEAFACGYDFPDFEEWLDPSLTRQRAEERSIYTRAAQMGLEIDDPWLDDYE